MSRDKILRQTSYWTEMLENAKENKLGNVQIADEIIKGVEEALNIQSVSNQRELLKGDYKDTFIEWKNKYFTYEPKMYEYRTNNEVDKFTLEDLHKRYERAYLESPFK